MSEPNTGSDLAAIGTTAVWQGDFYLLNGQKTFITNGLLSDLVIVVAKIDPSLRQKGISLKAQYTAELFFENVAIPTANVLGKV